MFVLLGVLRAARRCGQDNTRARVSARTRRRLLAAWCTHTHTHTLALSGWFDARCLASARTEHNEHVVLVLSSWDRHTRTHAETSTCVCSRANKKQLCSCPHTQTKRDAPARNKRVRAGASARAGGNRTQNTNTAVFVPGACTRERTQPGSCPETSTRRQVHARARGKQKTQNTPVFGPAACTENKKHDRARAPGTWCLLPARVKEQNTCARPRHLVLLCACTTTTRALGRTLLVLCPGTTTVCPAKNCSCLHARDKATVRARHQTSARAPAPSACCPAHATKQRFVPRRLVPAAPHARHNTARSPAPRENAWRLQRCLLGWTHGDKWCSYSS